MNTIYLLFICALTTALAIDYVVLDGKVLNKDLKEACARIHAKPAIIDDENIYEIAKIMPPKTVVWVGGFKDMKWEYMVFLINGDEVRLITVASRPDKDELMYRPLCFKKQMQLKRSLPDRIEAKLMKFSHSTSNIRRKKSDENKDKKEEQKEEKHRRRKSNQF